MKILISIYLLLVGLIFIFFVPIFQHSDEIYHFNRLSSLQFGRVRCDSSGSNLAVIVPSAVFTMPDRLNSNIVGSNKLSAVSLAKLKEELTVRVEPGKDGIMYNCLPPAGYFPNLLLSIPFRRIPILSFYVARFSGFLFFLVSLLVSLKIIPKRLNRLIMLFVVNPLVLFQVTGISYDVLLVSSTLIVSATFIRILEDKRSSLVELFLLCLGIVLSSISKQGYVVLIFLLLFIPKDKFKFKIFFNRYLYGLLFFVFLIVLSVFLYYRHVSFYPIEVFPWLQNPRLQLELLLSDPYYAFRLLSNTFIYNSSFYFRSSVGILGWLDIELSIFVYVAYILLSILFLRPLVKNTKAEIGRFWVLGMLVYVFSFVIFIWLLMWLAANNLGEDIIRGVQGRYYIPLHVLLMYLSLQIVRKKMISRDVVVFCILGFVLANITFSIYDRYYSIKKQPYNRLQSVIAEGDNGMFKQIFSKKCIIIESDDYLSGFQIIGEGRVRGDYLNNPIKYVLTSASKKRTGYLKLGTLQNGGLYEELIKPIKVSMGEEICLMFYPYKNEGSEWKNPKIMYQNDQPYVKLLYSKYL